MSNRDIHEVEEPKSGDEKAFKAKHKVKVTDYPEGTKVPPITTKKVKRIADPVNTETTYEEVEHLDEVGDTKKGQRILGKVRKRATNRLIKATDPMWTSKSGMTDDDKKSARKYQKVSQMVDDRMEEVETTFSIFWRDVNGMDKQKHGLSEEEVTRLATVLEAAGSVKIFIDEEEMTDAQKKKREDYVKGMKSKSDDLRKRYGKRWKDVMYAIATKNAMKEDVESLDEIAKSEEEPLHVQLRKRTNANEVSVTFKNGKTHVISRGHANKALTMLNGMKPADRQHAHGEMSKSHEHFMDALEGKMSAKPGKASISLGGNYRKEEVEELDELKKSTLASYVGKAAPEVLGHAYAAGMTNTDDPKTKEKSFRKAFRRLKGIEKATKRLAKEDVESLDENHRVGVTYSDPNSSSVTMRNEKKFKQVKVKAASEDEAIAKAKKHFKNNGYRVHDATITTMKEEVEALDEVGGQTSQVSAPTPPSRPVKPVVKKAATPAPTTVKEAGDVIPPKTPKMKSFSEILNNFKLDKPRANPTQKDRSLEDDG